MKCCTEAVVYNLHACSLKQYLLAKAKSSFLWKYLRTSHQAMQKLPFSVQQPLQCSQMLPFEAIITSTIVFCCIYLLQFALNFLCINLWNSQDANSILPFSILQYYKVHNFSGMGSSTILSFFVQYTHATGLKGGMPSR